VGEHGRGRRCHSLNLRHKQEAVSAGRDLAKIRSTEHVIHNQDGTISERNSYGSDPAHRPG
jgi:hypothetical protein